MDHRTNPDIDIIGYVLDEVIKARPGDSFCKSLKLQYIERGGLSKKQLQGLEAKALKLQGIHPGKLATLEAIIKKKPEKERAPASVKINTDDTPDDSIESINAILEKYPSHKRILLFKSKFEKERFLSAAEKDELMRFKRLLLS